MPKALWISPIVNLSAIWLSGKADDLRSSVHEIPGAVLQWGIPQCKAWPTFQDFFGASFPAIPPPNRKNLLKNGTLPEKGRRLGGGGACVMAVFLPRVLVELAF